MLPGDGPVNPYFAAISAPAGVLDDKNLNRPRESRFMMNRTDELQRLQLPSYRTTHVSRSCPARSLIAPIIATPPYYRTHRPVKSTAPKSRPFPRR